MGSMIPRAMIDRMRRRSLIVAIIAGIALVALLVFHNETAKAPDLGPQTTTPSTSTEADDGTGFDKEQFSLEDPNSIWVIVNKKRSLPGGFVPEDLIVPGVHLRLNPSDEQMHIRKGVEADLKAMFAAANKEGIDLVFGSGYRSEVTQKGFYDGYVAKDGKDAADTYSARPGHSEHQTGLAFDLSTPDGNCHLQICYADTPGGQWVAKHAYEYGFVIRYPKGKESVTGYQYEPWHLRYVGTALATEIQKAGQTLEEFFGLPPAANY